MPLHDVIPLVNYCAQLFESRVLHVARHRGGDSGVERLVGFVPADSLVV